MEKWGRLWGLAGRCLLAAGSWSWGVCRVCLMALILTFHLQGGALLLGLIVLSAAGILYKLQDSLLFFPDQPASSRLYVPAPTGVAHESVFIRAKDGVRLNLLLLRHPGDGPRPGSAPTVLYFHGNAGNVGHRVPNALLMLASLKANVALLDYRGYGRSEGEPSEAGLGLDAQAALDYVTARPDLGPGRVVLFGRSLGGAVAARLAAENPHRVAALVLENTFLSIPHVAAALCAFLPVRLLPLWCYRNRFPSHRHVARCRVPSLFVSGLADQLIPPVMMKRLYELSPARAKRMAVFPDGTHNHTWQCPGYFPALQQFVAGHARQEAAPGGAGVTVI